MFDSKVFLLVATVAHIITEGNAISPVELNMILRTYNDTSSNSRIVNGVESELFTRPYIASMQYYRPSYGWYHFCGAVIIDEDRLITAAHCLTPFRADQIRIEVGVINLAAPPLEYTQVLEALALRPHESYSDDLGDASPDDIGIVYLKQTIQFNANVQPVKIAPGGTTFVGQECVIAGWGRLWYQGTKPTKLRETNATVWSYDDCLTLHEQYEITIDKNYVCALGNVNDQGLGTGVCNGDSGSPLMCGDKHQYLFGITSYMFDLCGTSLPGVYTRVAGYNSWINNSKHPKYRLPDF